MAEDNSINKNEEKKDDAGEMKKARKIVLETIGREEEQVKIKKKKEKELKNSKPLFFKDKNFEKFEKEHPDLLIDEKSVDEEKNKKAVEEIKNITKKEEVAPVVKPVVKKQQEVSLKNIKPETEPFIGARATKAIDKKIKTAKKSLKKIKQSAGKKKIIKKNEKSAAPLTIKNLKVSKAKKEIFPEGLAWSIINNLLYTVTIAVLLFIIFYSFLIISITQLGLDNKITRKIADYIPVPAVITKFGIVEYYDYVDLMNDNKDNNSNSIVKSLILNNSENNIDFKNEKIKLWKLID